MAARIGVGQDATTWVVITNITEADRARTESTIDRRPAYFKEESRIEKAATPGFPEDCHIGNGEKTSKITLIVWVNPLRGYLKERGFYTVCRIFSSQQY